MESIIKGIKKFDLEWIFFIKLYFYIKEPNFYLGVGNPNRNITPNYFVGYFESFAYFDKVLDLKEIEEISENDIYYLRKDFGNYTSSDSLKCYLDSNFITKDYMLNDLSGTKIMVKYWIVK